MPIVQTLPGVSENVDLRLSFPADVSLGRARAFSEEASPGSIPLASDDPSDSAAPSDDDLGCIIEGEIIPRLLIAHRLQSRDGRRVLAQSSAERAAVLGRIVVDQNLEAAAQYVQSLVDAGTEIEDVFVDVVAHAARMLGAQWSDDQMSFVDVTIGLSRLQQLLHRFGSETVGYHDIVRSGRRALFLPTPGEQHTLGLLMVEDAYRRAGWEVWGGHEFSRAELHEIIVTQEVQLVGFSLSCESLLDELTGSIEDLRSSHNGGAVSILVGGRYFTEDNDAFRRVNADAAAMDVREAVRIGEELVDRSAASRV